jgi:hypothetical protein
MKTDG